jgi:hypothetical protein
MSTTAPNTQNHLIIPRKKLTNSYFLPDQTPRVYDPRHGGGRTGSGSLWETEEGAAGRPPLARAPTRHATKRATGGGPSIVGLALRFALNAPPFGLRRAALRSKPTDGRNRDVPGRAQRESLLLEPLDAKLSYKNPQEKERVNKDKQTQNTKRGHFYFGKQGDTSILV